MAHDGKAPCAQVFGPDGNVLILANLPSPQTVRWVVRRKAEIVAAVRGGLLSLEEACDRYALSADEFLAWDRALSRYGLPGLRTMRTQQYRDRRGSRPGV